MATDKYINTDTKNLDAQNNSGATVLRSIVSFEITAADLIDGVYRIFKNINALNRLSKITIMCDAITTLTDNDLGYYKADSGAVIDVDALMDGQTLASASRVIDGMSAVVIENIGERHLTLASETMASHDDVYDIALTTNVAATVTGTVTAIMDQEVAL